ncbi:CD80-like immunoglobulin C2-set [Trinorchestia longiramus]|nr:CD80-like immunoglobulin C2-set [Trinorchestia longiramus]
MAVPRLLRCDNSDFCLATHRKRRLNRIMKQSQGLRQGVNVRINQGISTHQQEDARKISPLQSGQLKNQQGCFVQSSLQWSVMLLSLALFLAQNAAAQADNEVEEVKGNTAVLPCRIPITADTTRLTVLWYKGDLNKAAYVFKASGSLDEGEHQADGNVWGGDRATFQPFHDPPALLLEDITAGDESIYRCKAFLSGLVHNEATRLRVLVPPDAPTILNSEGSEVNLDDVSYNEGETVELTCQVTGGKPAPFVSWYWDQELLDSEHDTEATGVVRNRLMFGPLTRNHTNARLVCHAQTHRLIKPLNTFFWINVRFKPSSVQIVTEESAMVVGETYRLQCQSVGADPPAELSWWLDGVKLDNSTHQIYDQVTGGGNMTLSTLVLAPVIQDKQKELQCRALSPVISHAPLTDSRILNIHYMGTVLLEMVSQDPSKGVVEGANVLMTCNVDSDPPAQLIHWYHKVGQDRRKLEGVEGPELSLVAVARNQSGVYTCVASSSVGEGHSNTIVLQVNYKPTCRDPGLQLVGTGSYEEVKLGCRVNSSPDPESYKWQLQTTSHSVDMPEEQIQQMEQISILRYTPESPSDYGTLYCWATNDIGMQDVPCKFELVAAVFPSPFTNCSASNNDTHNVFIECQGANDNGLPEAFVAEVYDITRDRLLRNISSSSPIFLVDELDPGSGYTIEAYTSNIRGHSEKLTLHAFTQPLLRANIDLTSIHVFPITPILGILIGIAGAVILMVIIVMVIMKLKTSKTSRKTKLKCGEPPMLVPVGERDFNKMQDNDGGGSHGGKHTLINFPPEPPLPAQTTPDVVKKEVKSRPAPSPPSPSAPSPEVEYAELEFVNDKKAKKKKKKTKSKKKKEMKDEETEYASIDHVRTMLNSPEYLAQQKKHREQNEELKDLPDPDSTKQPLIRHEETMSPSNGSKANKNSETDDRGRLIMPEGALESSV